MKLSLQSLSNQDQLHFNIYLCLRDDSNKNKNIEMQNEIICISSSICLANCKNNFPNFSLTQKYFLGLSSGFFQVFPDFFYHFSGFSGFPDYV